MKNIIIALFLLIYFAEAGAFPITTSERKTYTRQSVYTDGYQVNGAGQMYSYYREKQPDNSWGSQQELKLGEVEVKAGLQNQTIMLEGYDANAKTWVGYWGDGANLVAHNTNYAWMYGYDLTFDGSALTADIQIAFDWTNSGEANEQVRAAHMSLWEQNIEHWWSGRYEVVKDDQWHFPIFFDVTYDGYSDGTYDQHVSVLPGSGRANVSEWYLTDHPQTNAHEFGHMLGLYDEYWLGAIDPVTEETDYLHLMGADIGSLDFGTGLEDYYFSSFMGWLDSIDPDPTQTYRIQQIGIPEPGVSGLFGLGLALLLWNRRLTQPAGLTPEEPDSRRCRPSGRAPAQQFLHISAKT